MSYFWVYVVLATLVGNFLGYVIFFKGFVIGFFMIMGSISLFAAGYFAILKSNTVQDNEN